MGKKRKEGSKIMLLWRTDNTKRECLKAFVHNNNIKFFFKRTFILNSQCLLILWALWTQALSCSMNFSRERSTTSTVIDHFSVLFDGCLSSINQSRCFFKPNTPVFRLNWILFFQVYSAWFSASWPFLAAPLHVEKYSLLKYFISMILHVLVILFKSLF